MVANADQTGASGLIRGAQRRVTIDAPPLRFLGDHIEAEFLLERTGDEAPYCVSLPGGESDDLVDGGAGGSPQHFVCPGLLGPRPRPTNPRRPPAPCTPHTLKGPPE